jgi:ABC-type nitrate/sulfonate/bicarbonate transport system substrate-binding protein
VTTRGGTGWLKIPGAAVVCLALLLLLAPGGAGAPLTPVTITALPLEPAGLVFYAKEEGFFARQGLDAKILILSNPAQVAAALLSGGAQFAGAALSTAAILKSRNAPVRVVAAGALYRPSAPTTAVVAAPGEKIASARDLVGKTVAIDAPNTIAHIGLLKWLKRNGVSASEVNLRKIPFPEMLGPLRRGTVDAAVLPEPFLTLAVREGAKRIGDPFRAVCARTCLLTVFVARSDVDPLLAARVRNAIQAAAVWANKKKNDPASAAILTRYVGIDRTLIAKEARTRFGERLRPALAQPWIDALAEFGVIPASFAAIDLVK